MATTMEFTVKHAHSNVFGKITFPEGEASCPIVIFSHGFSACRPYDTGMERPFVERGIAFASFDFCNGVPGSQSSGSTKDMSVLTEAEDLEAVFNRVRALEFVDSRRVFLLGSSQGGYVSAYVASGRPQDVAGMALFFPAFNIGDDARTRLASKDGQIPEEMQVGPLVIGRRYIEDALSVDIFERIGSYAGDVLIVHGALDDVVPVEYSRRAARTFRGFCKLEVIDELGHGFRSAPSDVCERAFDLVADFFAARV